MKIEFNVNLIPKTETGQPLAKRATVAPADSNGTSFDAASALVGKLQEAAPVRQDAVDRARTLIADDQYPPAQTLRAIAHLLAIKLGPSSSNNQSAS